ncbi:regulatory protein GntR, HTH [Brachybacterium faecium]|uniref:Predicted transcriptional regulator n=1 Tax=Brachybacterium faecium (strain ATCC 43885 / DSM 4810 / JCM 11609 / LMG 19847 / NBRC 14762 / NCIMB 9860 / 6-10) TaxID=446465 RepID=C7M9U3_BRAFD|nr:GntR family transcriptional regulator [Brachybacterium faecium]ACU84637.1 predicted transcriptional regulator [Brachybacterium faecium DSM 4810]SLN04928.1 regulatory protein GntR, HTH [Brachybacterium faecium]HJG51257.1 GntR family transcriptional regulator [Brachybacterium faecium]
MHIPLDPSAPEPLYEQIRARLAEAILRGDLGAGQELPSLRGLARDLRVSVITTTRAYNELVADGLVDAVRGKGVFVRAQEPGQVRSRALDRIDTALAEAARTARTAGIGAEELRDRLAHALEEEDR